MLHKARNNNVSMNAFRNVYDGYALYALYGYAAAVVEPALGFVPHVYTDTLTPEKRRTHANTHKHTTHVHTQTR